MRLYIWLSAKARFLILSPIAPYQSPLGELKSTGQSGSVGAN
jgi:hypothetical protein